MSKPIRVSTSSNAIIETAWPGALPKSNELCFFSVTCEDYNLLWCFHEIHNNMEARLVWRCPNLEKEDLHDSDLTSDDKTNFFANHLPGPDKIGDERCNPHDYIFGRRNPSSFESAARQAATREAKITVYVVSSDPLQAELLFKLFAVIPSRVYLMKSADFFKPCERRYNLSIRVDRLAALRGSAHLKGFPSIVFDADSTMTYTAADSRGRLLGGGISPGLPLRLQSISGTTSSEVDLITETKLYDKLRHVATSNKPLPIFSNNSEDSVISTALSEVSQNARSIIKLWLEKVGPAESIDERRGKDHSTFCPVNNTRNVSVTGKNAAVLGYLLKANHGGVIESSINNVERDMNATAFDKLIPFGIQNVIAHQVVLAKEQFVNAHIHKRVAKEFLVAGKGVVIKRGVIVSVSLTQGINVFLVRYDDKNVEHVTSTSVVEMRKYFKKVGEEKKKVKEIVTLGNVVKDKSSVKSATSMKSGAISVKSPRHSVKSATNVKSASSMKSPRTPVKVGKNDKPQHSQNKKRSKDLSDENEKKKARKNSFPQKDPLSCIGSKIAKYFDADIFYGTVTRYLKYQGGLWHVRYEDGDEEDLDQREVTEALKLFGSDVRK